MAVGRVSIRWLLAGLARDLLDPVMPKAIPVVLMPLVSTAESQHVEGGQGPTSSDSTGGGWNGNNKVLFEGKSRR